jgi:hypothetical protein
MTKNSRSRSRSEIGRLSEDCPQKDMMFIDLFQSSNLDNLFWAYSKERTSKFFAELNFREKDCRDCQIGKTQCFGGFFQTISKRRLI